MSGRGSVLPTLTLVTLFPSLAAQETVPPDRGVWTGVRRVVAVGDVHGNYARFVLLLRQAGVIDREKRWAGGDTHLVQTGDVVDRGPHSKRVLDLLMALEREAPRSGGRVHFLIGNHEAMRLSGDFTYVHGNEFAEFRTADAARVREELFRKHLRKLTDGGGGAGEVPRRGRGYRRKWMARHPLDRFQFSRQMARSGTYGKWIRSHNAVVRIDDLVFLHGGVSSKYAGLSIRAINRTIRRDLSRPQRRGSMAADPLGPLWYRGLARGSGRTTRAVVDRFLEKNGGRRLVIGHTRSRGGISTRLGGRVVMIDVEGSRKAGPLACLLVENGILYELRDGRKRRLR